jgi:hypothetical protein
MARICGLLLGLAGCLLVTPGARAQGACTGWIAVESSPEEGAAIVLDGKDTGRKTPATLKGISCGRHTVELKKKYFVGEKKIVGVTGGEVVKARVTLVPNYAELEIRTDPKGAELEIDGRKAGKAPVRIKRMTAGEHSVTARMPDFHDSVRKFKILPGKPLDLKVSLRPAFGSIRITARKIKEAEVFVDGDALGTTPIELKRIVSGSHSVKVVKEGYKPYEAEVAVQDGQETVVKAVLRPHFGILMVTSRPGGANVVIDGKPRGQTPLRVKLSPGEHAVVVTGADEAHGKEERTVRIRLRKKHKLNVRLSVKTGSLMIDTVPFAAQIELDGKPRGRAPLSLKDVPIGTHVIVAKLQGKPPLIGKIEVQEGRAAVAEMNLNDPAKSVYKSGGAKKPKPKPEPELVPVAKAEPKPAPKPVVRAEPEPVPEPEPKPIAKIEPKPEPKPDPIAPPPPTARKSAGMSTNDVLAWTAAGTAGALIITSIVLFAVGESREDEADDYYQKYVNETQDDVRRQYFKERFTELDNQVAGLRTGGWVCLGVGAAAGAASVLLFLDVFGFEESSRTALRVNTIPGGAWVGIEGRF